MNSQTSTAQLFEAIRPRYPELAGQTALVTGSSRGIGKGIAIRLGREGMRVVITSNLAGDVETTTAELRPLGVDVLPVIADLAQAEDIERLFSEVQAAYGAPRLLVNNAANLTRSRFLGQKAGLLDEAIDVNIKGAYRCAVRAAEGMRANGGGSIIQISSVGGLRAHWRGLPYDMTKGAGDAMTRALALDLAEYGIRVNAVAPGFILRYENETRRTEAIQRALPRIPLARAGTPLDIAAVVAFLASEDASYITGQVLYVDGGITTQLSPLEAEI